MDKGRQGIKSNPIGKTGDFFTPSGNFCMEASLYLQGHGAYARQVIILATDGYVHGSCRSFGRSEKRLLCRSTYGFKNYLVHQ